MQLPEIQPALMAPRKRKRVDSRPNDDSENTNVNLNFGLLSLPDDVFHLIFRRLSFKDYVSCAGVCRSWRQILPWIRCKPCINCPWFMLDCKTESRTFWFQSLRSEFHSIYLQEPSFICGSSKGWLMVSTACRRNFHHCYLLNPFSMDKFKLPPLMFPVKSIVLSSPPTSQENCTLMAIGNHSEVAFLSLGERTSCWISVRPVKFINIEDAIYFKKKFYFITSKGKLGCFEKAGDSQTANFEGCIDASDKNLLDVEEKAEKLEVGSHCGKGCNSNGNERWVRRCLNGVRSVRKPTLRRVRRYLVKVDGKLVLVIRVFRSKQDNDQITLDYQMYKLSKMEYWERAVLPVDRALFLSSFSSVSYSGKDYEQRIVCHFSGNGGEDWWGYERRYTILAKLLSEVGNTQLVAPVV